MKIKEITLTNKNGMQLTLSNYGATILRLLVPTMSGELINVVVGLHKAEDYLQPDYENERLHLGNTIGRYAGRISNSGFTINGEFYDLFNDEGVHLHGGFSGFDKKYWDIVEIGEDEDPFVKMSCTSSHLEEGYPGNVQIDATFTLLESNAMRISYEAKTDQSTPINLTNHAYFNLSGTGSILDHSLKLKCDSYLESHENLIPTGEILPVNNSHFDYRQSRVIGQKGFEPLDDCFVVSEAENCAQLSSPKSKIVMTVSTNQPSIVVYTHDRFPDWSFWQDSKYGDYPAICFEAQNYPDAPNQKHFPNSILEPGETYRNEVLFSFDLK